MNIRFTCLSLYYFLFLAMNAVARQSCMPNVLYVKCRNDAGFDMQARLLITPEKKPLETLAAYGWWSRAHRQPLERLQELRRTAEQKLGRTLFDPASEFHFHLYHAEQLAQVQQLIGKIEGVEKVLRIPVPVNALAPDYTTNQQYVHEGNAGINADSVYLVYNNRGGGIRVCDIEYDFNKLHTDLPAVTWLGAAAASPYDDHHGTAVLGELASLNNGAGTTGIASDCQVFFAAACTMPDTLYDLEAPILTATSVFSPGDIILLEQQIGGPNEDTVNPSSQRGLVPVEWYEPYYNAILTAVGNGITVVEAAGNGQENLDAPEYRTGNGGHYPFLPANNSGAIVVGAGGAGVTVGISARSRLWYSNYGSRVDVQGVGEAVTTTGYGDYYSSDGYNGYYTNTFGGTSSASPVVTGAAALLQSVYKSVKGITLSPAQVRTLLRNNGKAQTGGIFPASSYHIGPLPDVFAAIRQALATTGINTPTQNETIQIYPNPASAAFTIKASAHSAVQIYNTLGALIGNYDTDANGLLHVSLADHPAGIYQVAITNNGTRAIHRLAVQ